MPWLQLEDEDLDIVGNVPATPKKTAPSAEHLDVGTILVVSTLRYLLSSRPLIEHCGPR